MMPLLPHIPSQVFARTTASVGRQAGRRIASATDRAGLVPPSDADRGTASPVDSRTSVASVRIGLSPEGTTSLAPFATPTLNPAARRHLASSLIDQPHAPERGSSTATATATTIDAVAKRLPAALQTLRAGLRYDAALRSAPLDEARVRRLVEGPQDYALCRLPKELRHERMTDLLRKLLSSEAP